MNVDDILSKIIELLFSFGFIKKKIGMYTNYVLGNTCCIPNYVGGGIGFLIEYADSEEDTLKNFHEDSDAFSPEIGEAAILAGICADIIREVPELNANMIDHLISNGFDSVYYSNRLFYVKDRIYCIPQYIPDRTKLFILYAKSVEEAESAVNEFEAHTDNK